MHPVIMHESDLPTLIERLNRVFEEELQDGDVPFTIALDEWDPGDGTRYRLRIRYQNPEDGSGESDLGPVFDNETEIRAFIRGLEVGGDGTIGMKASVL